MARYVILDHDLPHQHWDLMLEDGDALRTWRLAAVPEPGRAIPAEAIFHHRRIYLDYEGRVSRGRGRVVRWDAGSFTWEVDSSDEVTVSLEGERCRGQARLRRQAGDHWMLTFAPGPHGAGLGK